MSATSTAMNTEPASRRCGTWQMYCELNVEGVMDKGLVVASN